MLLILLIVSLPCWGMSQKTKRRLTFAAAVAAQVLDLHSSVGKREANPLLRGPDGRFDLGRGAAFKLGILGALFVAQELRPGAHWNWVNASYAGFSTAIAVRNYNLYRAKPAAPGAVPEPGITPAWVPSPQR